MSIRRSGRTARSKVECCILTFNRKEYLKIALDAVRSQTFDDLKIKISDNASVDGTDDYVRGLLDSRISYVRRRKNLGDNGNYRKVIRESCADFLFVTHDDDVLLPTFIEQCMQEFRNDDELIAVATNVGIIDGEGKVLQNALYPDMKDHLFDKNEYISEYIRTGLWLPPSTIGIRWGSKAQELLSIERTDYDYVGPNADVYNVCLMNTQGRVKLIGAPLAYYREHGAQMSMNDNFRSSPSMLYNSLELLYREAKFYDLVPLVQSASHLAELQTLLQSESAVDRKNIIRLIENTNDSCGKSTFLSLVSALVGFHKRFPHQKCGDQTRSILAMDVWTKRIDANLDGPFHQIRKMGAKRIAVLGTMSIAALLHLEACRSEIDIIAFVDGNLSQQGKKLHGVPIVPYAWLSQNVVDAIIISSEKDKFEGLRDMISSYVTNKCSIICWKIELLGCTETVFT